MSPEFRTRILLPIGLPVGLAIVIVAVAFSLSRVFLAITPAAASLLALLVALYILVLAFLIPKRANVTPGVLGMMLGVGLATVLGAGAWAAVVGPHETEPADDDGDEQPADAAPDLDPADADVAVTAVDLGYPEFTSPVPAGSLTFALENQGNLVHDLVIEEIGDVEVVADTNAGEVGTGTVDLDPGEYTFYCSIPGHRASMEETLVVE